MATGKIFKGTKGVEIRFHVDQDVSTAQELRIYYWLPESQSGGYWDAEAEGLGTIYCLIDEIDEIGKWFFQGWGKLSNEKELFTDILPYEVFEPLANRIT